MRWALLLVVACLALGLIAPSTAHGAKAAAESKDHAGKKGGHDKVDPDKIDMFKGTIDLTIWTIAVFLILFFVLSSFAWPQIRAGLDAREQAIAADKAEALKAKHEADGMRAALAAEQAKAADQVRQMMDKARVDAQATAAEELARGKAELASEKDRMNREMAREREQALQDVWSQGASLAVLISAKAIGKNLSEADHRALLAEALDEFKSSAAGRLREVQEVRG